MENSISGKLFWLPLLLTAVSEFLIPLLLKPYYPDCNRKTMTMSVLGSPPNPVRRLYSLCPGGFLTVTAAFFLCRKGVFPISGSIGFAFPSCFCD